ncbi:unnamed protein product [Calicophoron daubneyi]|uniref:Uncharacterized protein n=1 Tax=Calicophoron daubneyi TaxID=300641 RepID=A0AAV2T6E4_CALDB
MNRIYPGILPRCPTKDLVPDFPCPGHYKHSEIMVSLESSGRTPCGKAEALCSFGVFSDLRVSKNDTAKTVDKSPCASGDLGGSPDMLSKLLLRISTKNVKTILQLGSVLDTRAIATRKDVQEALTLIESVLREFSCRSTVKILNTMGDQESAIRNEYMGSFFGDFFREYGLIKQPIRCCGSAYYSFRCIRNDAKPPEAQRAGWGAELIQESGCLTDEDFRMLPPLHCAVSEQQLQWLKLKLEEATRMTDNVVIACHIPLHPVLVSNRSALLLNWKHVLRLILNSNCVRLVLNGRPVGKAATPPDPEKPYHYDHGILYYSIPPAWELTQSDNLAWTHMIAELGYDFIRIKGEGIHLPKDCEEDGWTITFEPRRTLRVNNFDYAFEGGRDHPPRSGF